jgi:uncharacterized damage-inducible protein DinB
MKRKTLNAFDQLEEQRRELLSFYQQFSTDQLQFKPDPNSWNLLQVLRHLVTAEGQSLIYIKRKINHAEDLPRVGLRATVRAFLLKIALALPIKFKAPKVAQVDEEYPNFEQLIDEWGSVRNEFNELLINTAEESFTKTVYKHPRAGYLSLKQAIVFMEDHIEHHRKQIGRIMSAKNFPVT